MITAEKLGFVVGFLRAFVDHGHNALGVSSAATRTTSLSAGKTNTEVVVPAVSRADVVGRGGLSMSACLPPGSPLFCQVQDPLLTCAQLLS